MDKSAVDQATDALRLLIARGRYQPGDRLPPERELAEGFGISRPTMREVIRRLVDAGLLEPRRGSGTYVADVDIDAVFEVRLLLEPHAAGLAATRRSREQAERLRLLVKRLGTVLDRPDLFAAVDLEMHATVIEAAAHPVLADALARLLELAKLSRAITSFDRAARIDTMRQMRLLVRAIRARDVTAATGAMEDHIRSIREIARSMSMESPRDRTVRALVVTPDDVASRSG